MRNREIVNLACEVCGRKNYTATRNKKLNKERISLKKYCRFDRKHTLHKESK
jgi:large subunit ribosomal protein L33